MLLNDILFISIQYKICYLGRGLQYVNFNGCDGLDQNKSRTITCTNTDCVYRHKLTGTGQSVLNCLIGQNKSCWLKLLSHIICTFFGLVPLFYQKPPGWYQSPETTQQAAYISRYWQLLKYVWRGRWPCAYFVVLGLSSRNHNVLRQVFPGTGNYDSSDWLWRLAVNASITQSTSRRLFSKIV